MRLLLQSKSFLSKKFCFNQNFQTRSRLHINLYILGRPFNMHVYWDLILEWSDSHLLTHICWIENNPDGYLLKLLVCLFLYLEVESVQKEQKKLEPWFFCFYYWLYLNFINTYEFYQQFYLLQQQMLNETNQHPQDTLCNYIRQKKQFLFLGLTLPKKEFRFWNSEE